MFEVEAEAEAKILATLASRTYHHCTLASVTFLRERLKMAAVEI